MNGNTNNNDHEAVGNSNGSAPPPATEPEPAISTRAIHAGQDPFRWKSCAVVPPISLSTTYKQRGPNETAGYDYSRSANPTRECLQEAIASLESAQYGLVFSSGLAALATITNLLKAGDHIICFDDVYGGTGRYLRTVASRLGLETEFIDASKPALVEAAIRPGRTRLVWMETPSNPTMKLVDIQAIGDLVKRLADRDCIYAVDNTFMTPYYQQPLALGADLAVHSVTKYLNGHSDVVMGAVATNSKDLYERLKYLQNSIGAVPSPFDCFLVNRGIKTLHLRMDRHMTNGLAVAQFLEQHPLIERVIHPGLKSHPQYELAQRQCSGYSGMVSFYIKGTITEARLFLSSLKYFTLAESLGCVESLIEIPSLMTHASVPEDVRAQLGIADTLIRLSVGVEDEQDLINDLNQALNVVAAAAAAANKQSNGESIKNQINE